MIRIAGWMAAVALIGMTVSGGVRAQTDQGPAVQAAAEKFAGGLLWRASTVLTADFNCTGKVQYALLGTSTKEIAVAVFANGLDQPPAVLRFEADGLSIIESKIRLDDYSMSAAEIAGLTGATPVGYRASTACHGVRLSDDRSDAAHIYWDYDNQRFDSWSQ
jgi:glucose/arabinose dehydrogenase